LLWGYTLFKHCFININANVLCTVAAVIREIYMIRVKLHDTLRALLLVSTTATPYVRHVELWLFIHVATADLIPRHVLVFLKLSSYKDRCLDMESSKSMVEW
jgi:hypothetical protein